MSDLDSFELECPSCNRKMFRLRKRGKALEGICVYCGHKITSNIKYTLENELKILTKKVKE